jgi:hypothetical protein
MGCRFSLVASDICDLYETPTLKIDFGNRMLTIESTWTYCRLYGNWISAEFINVGATQGEEIESCQIITTLTS